MSGRKGFFQCSRLLCRERRRRRQLNGQGIIEEGKFHDQVIGSTVKAGLIVLIGLTIVQRQVRIGVMGYQGVNRDLGRNAEGE